ncbi:hypothetical protein RI129_004239 [Pyrocoelia pectoralis]|uniref:Uncharacterized protein n=1 Tax=Pyrocoelia pectoralis TaxID=417401 RepID=A0AAN7VBY1_9COLE
MYYFIPLVLVIVVSGQRPSYLAGHTSYPGLAYRFRTRESSSSSSFGNGLGEERDTTRNIPIDARGEKELVDRLNSWPQKNRPFWLVNSKAIEAARNRPVGQNGNNQQVDVPRRFSERKEVRDQHGFNPEYDYDDY